MLGPAIRMATPWKMPRVPSVAISALTRAWATSSPFTKPPSVPSSIPTATEAPTGQPRPIINQPETTPTSDISDPTDRSNTPPIISIIMPRARIPSTARLFRTTRRFAAEKNDVG